ncbi:hypothetical protein P8918_13815 [Bacillus spizizenii]|nr:hypothetical protein [Bacillus spizizenii]MCY8890380.1 hypothetical protein [Bacillus spizizenii]MEC0842106.1 hypothetical protein [Bacillus spizizenii]
MDQQQIEQEFQQVRQAARMTSINILSLRIALVDKKLCTEEELEKYDKTAENTINFMMTQEQAKMEQMIREQFGDEAADEMIAKFNEAMSEQQAEAQVK